MEKNFEWDESRTMAITIENVFRWNGPPVSSHDSGARFMSIISSSFDRHYPTDPKDHREAFLKIFCPKRQSCGERQ
jgi:hypothetical protein